MIYTFLLEQITKLIYQESEILILSTLCAITTYNAVFLPFTLYNKKEDKFIHEFYHIFVKLFWLLFCGHLVPWRSDISRRRKLVSLCLVGIFFGMNGRDWKYIFLSENIIKLFIFSFIKICVLQSRVYISLHFPL